VTRRAISSGIRRGANVAPYNKAWNPHADVLCHDSTRRIYDVVGRLFAHREAADALEAGQKRSLASPRPTQAASAVIGIET